MNKFYLIPAVGEPKLIESEESVNKVWHDLMNDSDLYFCIYSLFCFLQHSFLLYQIYY